MTIVVTGATGQIGHALTQDLADAGASVAAIARHPEKLGADLRDRIDVRQGDLNDTSFVLNATRDADALFWLTPPNMEMDDPSSYFRKLGENAAQAIQENGIKHVVFISSGGAQSSKAGLISELGVQEKVLSDAAPNLYILRCGLFFENFLTQIESIKGQGTIYAVARPDVKIPMIATKDIADRAAKLLLDTSWSGQHTQGLHGPADLSQPEAAEILSQALGKTIRYVPITEAQASDALISHGASKAVAKAFAEMQAAVNIPGFVAEPRTPETTTPTTLTEWAEAVLKPAIG